MSYETYSVVLFFSEIPYVKRIIASDVIFLNISYIIYYFTTQRELTYNQVAALKRSGVNGAAVWRHDELSQRHSERKFYTERSYKGEILRVRKRNRYCFPPLCENVTVTSYNK